MKNIFADKRREHFLKHGAVKGVHDEHLIHREIYNPNKAVLILERNELMVPYIFNAGISPGPKRIEIKPESWGYLTHGYYFSKFSDGGTYQCTVNYGDSIGIGNKYPSLPILE